MRIETIGNEIKKYRKLNGLTQEELSEKVGVTRNYISLLERGVKAPKLETLIKIANALKVSANTLLKDYLEYDDMVKDYQLSQEMSGLTTKDRDRILGFINVLKEINSKYLD